MKNNLSFWLLIYFKIQKSFFNNMFLWRDGILAGLEQKIYIMGKYWKPILKSEKRLRKTHQTLWLHLFIKPDTGYLKEEEIIKKFKQTYNLFGN